MASVAQLVPTLMTAIGPAILVSAVGMLLLTLTNRLGRVIDRTRALAAVVTRDSPSGSNTARAQLDVMWRRARLIRLSIALACTSALCAGLLVMALFLAALVHLEIAWLIALLFLTCLGTLVGRPGDIPARRQPEPRRPRPGNRRRATGTADPGRLVSLDVARRA